MNETPNATPSRFGAGVDWAGEHPGGAFAALYLYASVLGALYSWILLGDFDVDIFMFASPDDFLLAAYNQPVLVAVAVVVLGLVTLQSFARLVVPSSWLQHLLAVVAVGFTGWAAIELATSEAEYVRAGWGIYAHVQLQDDPAPELPQPLIVVSQVSDFLFLHHGASRTTHVLPRQTASYMRVCDKRASLRQRLLEFVPSRPTRGCAP
jgi:hypothetical protein